jgi:polar amino acid transport system substrate-binding protein
MFGGVVFVAFYTAQLTSTLTVQKIRSAIQGPADLPGQRVGTIANSVAVNYLQAHHAQVQEFVTPDQMYKALLEGRVNAVVFGAPVLLYYASHQGSGLVMVVGAQFNTLPVAMFFPAGSPLRKRVNTALTALRENGTYQRLYDKWFGSE